MGTETTVLAHLSDVHLSPVEGFTPSTWGVKRTLGWINWHSKRRFIHTRAALDAIPGHAAERCGEVLSLRQVLPWWNYRKPKPAASTSTAAGSAADPIA